MFSGRPSVPLSVRASVRDSRGSFMFPRYLQYLLTNFRQTFVTGASWDTDDLITFLGRKVKGQGHTIAAEVHSTRRYRRVQLFLVFRQTAFLAQHEHAIAWCMAAVSKPGTLLLPHRREAPLKSDGKAAHARNHHNVPNLFWQHGRSMLSAHRNNVYFQCFEAVGWATGRASGL